MADFVKLVRQNKEQGRAAAMSFFDSDLRRGFTRAVTSVFLCLCCLVPCFATFTLDPTFGGGGRVMIAFPDSTTNYRSEAFRAYVQPSGRILVGGSFTNGTADGQLSGVAWAGLAPDGNLDPGFDFDGVVTDWRPDAFTNFNDALMYSDGSTLRMSQVFRLPAGSSSVSTVRLGPNGGIDSVYGNNATFGLCGGFCSIHPVQIAARGDGKILAFIVDQAYLLYRRNPDGTPDPTFGSNGVVQLIFNKFSPTNFVEMIALDDGKTLLIGHVAGSSEFFLARLTETGMWDKTFGRVGILRVPFGSGLTGSVAKALVQPDGKILLAGSVSGPDANVWMTRFRSNGRRDITFGNNGVVMNDFAPGATDVARSIALSPDGKIRLAGHLGSPTNFLVARYSSSGLLEDSTTFEFTPGQYAEATDVALQPSDGKVLVVGRTKNPNATINGSVFAIARLTE